MPCCNLTVNIGFLAAHEDRNTVKLQSRFFSDSPLTEMNHFCSYCSYHQGSCTK